MPSIIIMYFTPISVLSVSTCVSYTCSLMLSLVVRPLHGLDMWPFVMLHALHKLSMVVQQDVSRHLSLMVHVVASQLPLMVHMVLPAICH